MVGRHGYKGNGRSYLIADSKGGWVCSVVGGKRWVAQRVPDDEIMVIRDCFNIREVNLSDTENFLGSKDLIRYAKRRGWYSPSRDGAFDFAKAYSATSSSIEGSFSNKPEKKIHRRDVSKLLTEPSTRTDDTALTTVFTKVPESCHRYPDPDMALARHFSDTKDFRERWPEVLRKKDGGEAILQPCSPCPIYDYKGPEARSGKYFLLVHNTFDFNGLTSYQNHGPLYKLDGEYVEGAHQPIWFTDKGFFSPRDTGNSFYTSYTAQNGRGVLWFGDQKFYLFGRILEK